MGASKIERGEVKLLAKEAYGRGWRLGVLGSERALGHVRIPFPTLYETRERFIEERLLDKGVTAADATRILSQIEKGFKDSTAEAFGTVGWLEKRNLARRLSVGLVAMAAVLAALSAYAGILLASGLE